MIFAGLLLVAALWLGFANGANDNMKGVATLIGSRTFSYRQAFTLATVSTLIGSVASIFLAEKLLKNFSGKGLVPADIVADPAFLIAVGIGAAATVLLASRLGIPISTTHALTGALIGAGLVGALHSLNFAVLGQKFMVPLLVSPVLAVIMTMILYPAFRAARRRLGIEPETCICIQEAVPAPMLAENGTAAFVTMPTQLTAVIEHRDDCMRHYQGHVFGISAQTLLDKLHIFSAAAVSFARGLNDTPKIAALLISGQLLDLPNEIVLAGIGLIIAVGGFTARRVSTTMSEKITRMNAGQGFAGNLVTAFLVIVASRMGVPVSTTHVSCGALFGIGVTNGQAQWSTIRKILLAWVITLPIAAAISALTYWAIH